MEYQEELHCCVIECKDKAEYEIWFGNKPDDFTHACLKHIPDLMTDADMHTVFKL